MKFRTHRQDGHTILESLVAIAIMGLIMAATLPMLQRSFDRIKVMGAAKDIKIVSDAASRYVKDNSAALIATATAAAPAIVTIAQLQTGGYLDTNFNGTNAFGQTYSIHVLEPSANRLSTLVATRGGVEIPEGLIAAGAASVAPSGGYIPASANTTARGPFGSWVIANTANYWNGANPNPGQGHLVAVNFFDSNSLADDFLYRNAVPGNPAANQMNTAIDMNAQDLNNVKAITTNAGVMSIGNALTDQVNVAGEVSVAAGSAAEKKVSQGIYYADIVGNGSLVPKPTCLSGSSPQIFLAPVRFSNDAAGGPLQAVQTWAVNSGTNWQVNMRVLTTAWTTPNATYGKLMVFTKCG